MSEQKGNERREGNAERPDMISVIVPCYNEEESLSLFYEKVREPLDGMAGVCYELVFVDDGSSDGTLAVLRELCGRDSRCRYLSFSRNFGKEAAMYAGLREAKGDYCVFMDADLQHPPYLLPQMYEAVSREGYDCCGGKRCGREGDGGLRSLCSRLFYKIGKALTHMDMADGYGDFRMMNRAVADAVLEMKEYHRYMKGIFSFVGFRTKWIPFQNVQREAGSSKWSMRSLLSYAAEGIFAFSVAPLNVAGMVGALLLAAGIGYLGIRLLAVCLGKGDISGFDILLAALLLLSGMQMLLIHIVGIYLARDCTQNKHRPLYIVRERG